MARALLFETYGWAYGSRVLPSCGADVYRHPVYRRVGWRPRVSGANRTPVSELALQVVAKRAGPSASATLLAAVARRTYEDLSEVAAPLIGRVGMETLMSRAVHLARREYPWLGSDRPDSPQHEENAFAEVARCLEQAEAGIAAGAAAAVFARSAGLLATLIGDGLTASLLYKAWPDALPVPSKKRSDNE